MRFVELANGSMFLGQNGLPCAGKHFEVYGAYWYACVFIFLSVCSCTQNTTTPGVFYESCFLEALWCPSCIREVWQCFLTQFSCTFADSKQKLWPLLSLLWKGIFAHLCIGYWIEQDGRKISLRFDCVKCEGDTEYLLGKIGSNGICTSRLALSQAHAHSTPQFLAVYAWHHSSSQWATSSSTRAFCDRAEPLILDSKAREDIISTIL